MYYASYITDWGVDRYHRVFTWKNNYSFMMKQACGYNIVQGQRMRTFRDITDTKLITYGLDRNGVQSPYPDCIDKYYYRYTERGPHTRIDRLLPE